MVKTYSKILFSIFFITASFANLSAQYRVALSFDGNSYDADDLIAAPMALAILEESGNKDKLIHCDYSNNLYRDTESKNMYGDNTPEDQATEMKASIDGAISRWGYNANIFFEVWKTNELENARTNFMNAAAAAFDANEPLYYIVGGPMQAPIKMIEKINENTTWSEARKNDIKANIIALSHSTWNERFGNNSTFDQDLPTWTELIAMGIKNVELADQNTYDEDNDMSTPVSKWEWLKDIDNSSTTDRYDWLFNRNPFFNNKFDPSDAGMLYWVINGTKGYSCCNNADLRSSANTTTSRERYASPAKIYTIFTGQELNEETNGVPSDITLEASATNCNTVVLTWNDTDGETAYRIRRKVSGEATFTNITDVAANVITYSDVTVSGGTNYIYMVRPLVDNVAAALSNQPLVITPECEGGGNTGGNSTCGSYGDVNGLVIMETEFTNSNLGLWIEKTDVSGYTGSGHLEFTGNDQSSGPPTSPLTYTFTITNGGVYRLMIKARKRLDGAESDKSNDCYVKLDGDFDESPNANDVHNGDALEADLRRNLKFFGGNANNWGWALQLDLGGENNKRNAVYTFKNGETYTLTLHGRSKNFNMDKIVFFKTAEYTLGNAQSAAYNASETCASGLSVTDNLSHNNIKLFPNPVKNVINLVEFENKDYVKIYDLTGKLILNEPAKQIIDLSKLKSGVYLIKLGDYKHSKFVKQ